MSDQFATVPTPAPNRGKLGRIPVKALKVVLVMVLLGAIGGVGYLYWSYDKIKKELTQVKASPNDAALAQAQQLVDEVGKLIALPEDETPTVATVVDKDKLQEQTFFAKAENGDKILIYPNAKKVYIYRESVKKIIEVGTLNVEQAGKKQ